MPTATMLIKAAPGKIVKGPGGTRVTDAVPVTVPCTGFWRRRLRAGDVVPGDAAPASAPASEPEPMTTPELADAPVPEPEPASTPPIRRRRRDEPTGEES